MIQYPLEKSFQYEEDYAKQKNDDGNPVYSMHHFNIYVGRSGRIFSSKKISPYFAQRKKFPPTVLLLLAVRDTLLLTYIVIEIHDGF